MTDLDKLDALRKDAAYLIVRAEIDRALDYIESLHNAYPAMARELRELRGALERISGFASRQLAEPREHDGDQAALIRIATACDDALDGGPPK